MATVRQSALITATIRIPAEFTFSDDDDELSQVRGGTTVMDTIEWTQGDPTVPSLDATNDFTLKFYSDAAGNTEITSGDAAYNIGDQTLAQIFTLANFVDNGDGTGSVDIQMDPSGITAAELTAMRTIYLQLEISQPDPGE